MRNWIKNNKWLFIKLCTITCLLIFLIVCLILKNNQGVCEAWTRGFSRTYQNTLGWVFKYLPFSLTEWLIIGAVIGLLIYLVLTIVLLCKRKFKRGLFAFCNVLLIALGVLTSYFATAEMAYNREALPIELYEEKVDKSEFRTIIDYYLADLNYCTSQLTFDEQGEITSTPSIQELASQAEKEYQRLADNEYFTSFTTLAKPMAFSFLFREFQLTGVTFLPSTEANVSYLTPENEKPFTVLHEVAHSKGVMREEDANMVAAYLSLTSDNPLFRYSGYTYTLYSLLDLANYTGRKEEITEVYDEVPYEYLKNQSYSGKYWNDHDALAHFANWWNDLYLKFSGEEKGTESYSDTPIEVDPSTREITSFSAYQKLYFQIYYSL